MHLPWEVAAVTDPDRERVRTERGADPMHSMLCSTASRRTAASGCDRLPNCTTAPGRAGPGTCSSSSRRCAGRAGARSPSARRADRSCPTGCARHARRGAHETEDGGAVVQLVEDVARLAGSGNRANRVPRATPHDGTATWKCTRSRREVLDVHRARRATPARRCRVVLGGHGIARHRSFRCLAIRSSVISNGAATPPSGRTEVRPCVPPCKARPHASKASAPERPQAERLQHETVLQPTVHRDDVTGGLRETLRDEHEDRLGLIVRLDRRLGERALRVEAGKLVARPDRLISLNASPYLPSDAITRSRGNIVLPFTTVAGATAFTRTSGAISTASSRTR